MKDDSAKVEEFLKFISKNIGAQLTFEDEFIEDDIGKIPKELEKLINNLVASKINEENNQRDLIDKIIKIKEKNNRFLYSHITAICYELNDQEKEENILWNLRMLHSYSKRCKSEYSLIIFKLYDHVNLAVKQSNRFRNIT